MSKIKLILAAALTACVLCLAACGESKDNIPAPTQSNTAEPASRSVAATSAADPTEDRGATEATAPDTDRRDNSVALSAEEKYFSDDSADSPTSRQDSGSAAIRDNDAQSSATVRDNGSQSPTANRDNSNKSPVIIAVEPTETDPEHPGVIDNAEVDFNDL